MHSLSPFEAFQSVSERHPGATDVAVAVLMAGLASLWLWAQWPPERLPATAAVAGLGLLQCLPLAWRRRFPLAVLAVVTAGTVLYGLAGGGETPWTANAWLLAAYTAGAYGDDAWRTPARGLATIVYVGYVALELFVWLPQVQPVEPGTRLVLSQLFTLIGHVGFVVWVWWFGDAMRIRHQREAQLAERTSQLEQEREANARRAILDERVRIARELHDVVAHYVSLMGIQAGAARRVLNTRPGQAAEVLKATEATSRDAVRELHRLLGFLRREEEDGLAPQPSLRQLDSLVVQMRDAGLPVALTIAGQVRPVSPGVDLSAYRIVQEALTNTLKHAGAAPATVSLHYGDRALEILVTDDGGALRPGVEAATGVGLIGMRERVGLLGGWLQAGPRPEGGFAVRALLPLEGYAK